MCFGRFIPNCGALGWCPPGALGLKTSSELPGEADAGAFKIPISASITIAAMYLYGAMAGRTRKQ